MKQLVRRFAAATAVAGAAAAVPAAVAAAGTAAAPPGRTPPARGHAWAGNVFIAAIGRGRKYFLLCCLLAGLREMRHFLTRRCAPPRAGNSRAGGSDARERQGAKL